MKNELGRTVKEARKALKMTTALLADNIQLSQGYISHIENGNKIPAPDVLKKIADELNLKYEELLELAGYKDLAKLEKMKNDDVGYLEQMKTVEDAVEWLNMLWAAPNESYKLVIEKNGEERPIYIDEVLKESTKLYFKEYELTNEEREKLYAILDIVYKK